MSSYNNKILIDTLPKRLKPAVKFVRHQEQASGLSTSRFIQDFSVCMIPKAVFSRSVPDLTENTFLEGAEETLIYFTPAILGEQLARKAFSKGLKSDLKKEVAVRGAELLKKAEKDIVAKENNKKVVPVKAAIALSAMAIPLTEFSLNYIKNIMTLKLFNKSDFKNIASLESSKEDVEHQKQVKESAKKHIKLAGALYAGCLALAGLLAVKGKKSKFLQKISEFIVAPGTAMFKKSPKLKDFVNKYFCMDFNSQNGKLVLSKGQLTTCVLVGGAGYFGASADRGKENLKETATRFPIVGAYVIMGSAPLERCFRKLLHKHGKCSDLIDNKLRVPKVDDLGEIAENIALKNKTSVESEYKKLAKQKVMISGFPYIFSIGIMGFFVAGLTTYFTRKRYEKEHGKTEKSNTHHMFGGFAHFKDIA